jgi:large subunit ribosomal protein L18
MDTARAKREARLRRHRRVRRRVLGTTERPRLAVFRSNRHIYVQIIDDTTGRTLASAGSLGLSGDDKTDDKTKEAKRVGAEVARRARQAGISAVVFDRGGYQYHGRVQALAEAAREGGLDF